MITAIQHCKVFSKEHTETPIADVTASIFENGRFWHGSFLVSAEELVRFGLDLAENLHEFLIQLDDGRRATFIENRREMRFGERGVRLHVMGTKALQV